MPLRLPYPGFSWSFMQHAVGLEPNTLYDLLTCAVAFEGQEDVGEGITNLIIQRRILTENIRQGRADAWRDYQQILPELGLIYSTLLQPRLTLTPAGKMFLAGEIGFAELMTAQALRYQYPNGQKATIQKRTRTALETARWPGIPGTLMELQASTRILLKPGLLVLRILLELRTAIGEETLTVDDCVQALLFARTNSDWPVALSSLTSYRRDPTRPGLDMNYARRNFQDWFKFLARTDIFKLSSRGLHLSAYAIENVTRLREFCEQNEQPEAFWVPPSYDREGRLAWFQYFGEIPYESQALMRSPQADETYIAKNYVAGFDEEDDEQLVPGVHQAPGLNLASIDTSNMASTTPITGLEAASAGSDIDVAKIRRGIEKRQMKTRLHDEIVRELASRFSERGGTVFEDRDSVDLLVRWPVGSESIFEVKTVNRRSLQDRLRKAIGQVQEYSYRRRIEVGHDPEKVVVLNTALLPDSWQVDFLTQHLDIGLICKASTEINCYVGRGAISLPLWAQP